MISTILVIQIILAIAIIITVLLQKSSSIGLGAYRGTTTKKDIKSILGDDIDRLASLSIHKVGAIGGVRLEDRFENITYLVIGSGLIK